MNCIICGNWLIIENGNTKYRTPWHCDCELKAKEITISELEKELSKYTPQIASVDKINESIWGDEAGISLWIINTVYGGVILQIVDVPNGNKILAMVTLSPHRAERLGQIMPTVIK